MRNFDSWPTPPPLPPKEQPPQPEVQRPRSVDDELRGDAAVEEVFDRPEIRSYTSIAYEMPEAGGRDLPPSHRLAFVIPEEFRNRIVRDVILRHRKDAQHAVDIGADRHDPHGAYSRVELHDPSNGSWRGWRDPKGYSPDKFAEPRPSSDPECEVLHDWLATVGEVRADAVRVTNVGKHPEHSTAQIHGVEVVFFPELEGVTYQERVYCAGTSFIDIAQRRLLPTYGGGSHTEGVYTGALPLNERRPADYAVSHEAGAGASLESGQLTVILDAGQSLAQVEVSVGDTEHLDTINPKTGRRTRLGYAKLWVGVHRAATESTEWFIENANIPPQGVIAGGPHLDASAIQPGDTLVIEARADTAYVMGWRVAYRNDAAARGIPPA